MNATQEREYVCRFANGREVKVTAPSSGAARSRALETEFPGGNGYVAIVSCVSVSAAKLIKEIESIQ
jgi:hypothetical protein